MTAPKKGTGTRRRRRHKPTKRKYKAGYRVSKRKQLLLTERQARVSALYHQGHTMAEISKILKEERPGEKHWAISITTVKVDLDKILDMYREQAVEEFEKWVLKELLIADEGYRAAAQAFELSRKIKKERSTIRGLAGDTDSMTNETIECPPDHNLSREKREWQNQRIRLIELIAKVMRESRAEAAAKGQTHEQDVSAGKALEPYVESIRQFMQSIFSQSSGDVLHSGITEQIHTVHPDPQAGPIPLT